jgi:hypothetical protein|tara:strand:+ start:367 stop:741 length:375 start_codon:yes stop_codon:yes gene_type:complete
MSSNVLSDKFKQKVLDSFEEGLSAKEISDKLCSDYSKETGKVLNRNVCLGIKFRAGKCITTSKVESHYRQRKSRITKATKGYIQRKCLCCQKEEWIEEHCRICPTCKKSESFKYSSEEFQFVQR